MTVSDILREQLLALIDGHVAHMPFDAAVADFPDDAVNGLPPNIPYTPWHLLEHIRIAQRDILDYIRNRAYLAPTWPGRQSSGQVSGVTGRRPGARVDGVGTRPRSPGGGRTPDRRRCT